MYKNLSLGALGHSVPFDQACAIAKKNNFAGVDLDLGYLSGLGSAQAAKSWFAGTGLKAGGFGLSASWRDWDSEKTYADSLAKVIAEAQLAAELGCTRCYTWVMPRSEKLDFYQHFDLVVPRLARVAEILTAYGIMLGFEFVGPATMRTSQTKDFVHTLDGMRAFAAAIGMRSLNTGILLDCFHWFTAHGLISEIEHLDPKEVVYVHVNDGVAGRSADEQIDQEREMVGATGVVDIAGFLGALRKIGYDGPVTVEPFSAAVKAMTPDAAAALTSAALDKVLGK